MTNAYTLHHLHFHYPKNFTLAIDHLVIDSGKVIGVTGLNGSGKSTFMKLLAFLLLPQAGTLRYFDQPVTPANALIFRKKVSLLLQDTLLLKRSVFENVAYGLKIRSFNHIKERVRDALEQVGLPFSRYAKKQYNELSGGEAKRVALASRLAIAPDVLLLDEPTTNIDKLNKEIMARALTQIHQEQHKTLIVSSHDEPWLAALTTSIIQLPLEKI